MPIKGLSEIRRLPRLGVIRLGIKTQTASGAERPMATDYFVCPPEVQRVYGEKPKELDIKFPINDKEVIFSQYYKQYGLSAGLKRKCDGVTATVRDEATGLWTEQPCDCTPEQHKVKATLNFMLPRVNMAGIY